MMGMKDFPERDEKPGSLGEGNSIRILLIGKSIVTLSLLGAILSVEKGFEVVGMNRRPENALKSAKEKWPDAVLVDVPLLDSFHRELISAFTKTGEVPVVVITSTPEEEIEEEMLNLGVLGVLPRPKSTSAGLHRFALDLRALLGKNLRSVSQSRKEAHLAGMRSTERRLPIIAIALSAGGPSTLRRLLDGLPPDIPAAIVVTQHIDSNFFNGFAEWLENATGWKAQIVKPGDILSAGKVFLISPSIDLELDRRGRFREAKKLRGSRKGARPSADDMFLTLAKYHAHDTVAVVLTGMGNDGALGAQALKEAGGYVIAESKDDSLVFGMPKSVIEAGAANEVLSLSQMPGRLTALVKKINKEIIAHSGDAEEGEA